MFWLYQKFVKSIIRQNHQELNNLRLFTGSKNMEGGKPAFMDGCKETKSPCGPKNVMNIWFTHPWMILKDVLLLGLAVPGLVALLYPAIVCEAMASKPYQGQRETAAVSPESCSCGSSVKEAISRGCKYDSLAAAWLPEHCRDEELTAQFDRMGHGPNGEWTYWIDDNHTMEIPLEELGQQADDPDFLFYTTGEWHLVHCLFYWRKQYRARFSKVTVEPRFDNEHHIMHCITVSLDPNAYNKRTESGIALNADL